MFTSDFYYNLPQSLIAQTSVEPRDHSRLMVVNKKEKKTIACRYFYDILNSLKPGDLLVWNNSKVFKARLLGQLLSQNNAGLWEHKRPVEIFLVRPMENNGVWKVLGKPGRHIQNGMRIEFAPDFMCDVVLKEKDGAILVEFFQESEKGRITLDEASVRFSANIYGHIPIPPYIKNEPTEFALYQTIYSKHEGSVAAPTAGFHFTAELIAKIKQAGIDFAEVTLHVGLGTFLPVKTERVEDHFMHSEWVELSEENAEKINQAKREGRRVIAVGTTTVRALEGIVRTVLPLLRRSQNLSLVGERSLQPYTGDINLFITSGFEFKIIDALITNFHLPKSTLLMLVCAFAGDKDFMLECYREAIKEKYRFFSFGDAMFIE